MATVVGIAIGIPFKKQESGGTPPPVDNCLELNGGGFLLLNQGGCLLLNEEGN